MDVSNAVRTVNTRPVVTVRGSDNRKKRMFLGRLACPRIVTA